VSKKKFDLGEKVPVEATAAEKALIDGLQAAVPAPQGSDIQPISAILRSGSDLSPFTHQALKIVSWMALPMLVCFGVTSLLAGRAPITPAHPRPVINPDAWYREDETSPAAEPDMSSAQTQRMLAAFPAVDTSKSLIEILSEADALTAFKPAAEAPSWWKHAVNAERARRKAAENTQSSSRGGGHK
jgi:hypothetical protein